jgi:hypothetical protein
MARPPRPKKTPLKPQESALILRSAPSRRLSKAQREFNRLIRQVEDLRKQLAATTTALDELLELDARRLKPLSLQRAHQAADLIRLLHPHLHQFRKARSGRKRQFNLLRKGILDLFDILFSNLGQQQPQDLLDIFARVNGATLQQELDQAFEEERDALQAALKKDGIDVDLSDLGPEASFEEISAKLGIPEEPEGTGSDNASSPAPRAAPPRDITALYRQLAKLLHPDLEQDPVLRTQKEASMKELTSAYKENDLHTLLRIELQWITREEARLDQLSDARLSTYNPVLREQIDELTEQIQTAHLHPRYSTIRHHINPMFGLVGFEGLLALERAEQELQRHDRWLRVLRGDNPISVLPEIIDYYDTPF